MLKSLQRYITRTALPHPWFDPEHPMLKPDPQIMKMMKHREKIGKLAKPEEIDVSMEENNTPPLKLYELTKEDYLSDPPVMEMFTKLYAHFNPSKILDETEQLPQFAFNHKIQSLSNFDTNYSTTEVEKAQNIDTRYIISRFCPPKFKKLIDIVLKKLPIYGAVVPLSESEQFFELSAALDKQIVIFFFGEGPFFDELDRFQYRRSILKQVHNERFLDNREIPFVTEAEDNFLVGIINWAGSDDHEYRTVFRPYFREYKIEKELWLIPSKNIAAKFMQNMWFYNYYNHPKQFANTVAVMIIDRLKKYLSSREFNYGTKYTAFDLPGSFVARNNLLILHIFMVGERLRQLGYEIIKDINQYTLWQRITDKNIRREVSSAKKLFQMISFINQKMNKMFDIQTEKSLSLIKIHPAQRKKIKSICEKQAESVTYLLYKHFEKENKGHQDIDVLMHSIFYPQKLKTQNFSEFVYQISEYVMKHREYLSHLEIEDIKNSNIDWDVLRIDENVIKLMKKNRENNKPEFVENNLDENDLQVIETLETVLPEEKRVKTEKIKKVFGEEKYKPINRL